MGWEGRGSLGLEYICIYIYFLIVIDFFEDMCVYV